MRPGRRRFLVPEVVQSSAMDCGPAALKSYLEGHGIPLSYGRLREACQTQIDGTSIEALEELANGFGVPVEEVLLPKESLFLPAARSLPAIAVLRLPNGSAHFAVIWNVVLGLVQVMDPAHGRRWFTKGALFEELFQHRMTVPAAEFREWAGSEEGRAILESLGRPWATPVSGDQVSIEGAVLLRPTKETADVVVLPESIAAAREEARPGPLVELWQWVKREGILEPGLLLTTTVLSAAAVVVEGLFFRAFLSSPVILSPLVVFLVGALLVDFASFTGELRLGRRLERSLREAFQRKVPRLADRYFGSRLTSDMAERHHSLHLMRKAPKLARQILREAVELLLTALAVLWLAPKTAPIVVAALLTSILVPLAGQKFLFERDSRVRSHLGGLSRFYLDALLGLVPLRVHGASDAIRFEHETLLGSWARARLSLQRAAVGLETIQFTLGYGLVVLLVFSYLRSGGEAASALLLAYWSLNLPVSGLQLARFFSRVPEPRNTFLRISEPLGAPEERDAAPKSDESVESSRDAGAAIAFEDVTVRVAGRDLLHGVGVRIEPGTHVAIVGPSGAGKTTLLGTLLGFHFPERGRVLADGAPLSGDRLGEVRAFTAWVDPAVQLWNRSLEENLGYGNDDSDPRPLAEELALPRRDGSRLGEGGALISGGEGQRVRLARALLRKGVRLVLLDEPLRGLDRKSRSDLLRRAREQWKEATLLAVTHDVRESQGFDRILVIEGGRIVEDGRPEDLLRRKGSVFCRLLEAERELSRLWADGSWRSWRIENGELVDAV